MAQPQSLSGVLAVLLTTVFTANNAKAQNYSAVAQSYTAARAELEPLCAKAQATATAEEKTLRTYTSPALEEALRSGPALWKFITDPATSYLDRMAAAKQGGAVMTPEQFPELWSAVTKIENVGIGVNPSPCNYLWSANMNASWWLTRKDTSQKAHGYMTGEGIVSVLGRAVTLPEVAVDYPVTAEERDHAPWLWQMQGALQMLNDQVNIWYGDASRYPLRVEAAWKWQPSNFWEARVRQDALLSRGPRNVLRLQTIVKMALDGQDANLSSYPMQELYVYGQDSPHFEELTHVAQIIVLQRTKRYEVALGAANGVKSLATIKTHQYSGQQTVPLRTATSLLAVGRWAMDRSLRIDNRYLFAEYICQSVEEPPFQLDMVRDWKDPEVERRLAAFEGWFLGQQPVLEKQAAQEHAHLQTLAEELGLKVD